MSTLHRGSRVYVEGRKRRRTQSPGTTNRPGVSTTGTLFTSTGSSSSVPRETTMEMADQRVNRPRFGKNRRYQTAMFRSEGGVLASWPMPKSENSTVPARLDVGKILAKLEAPFSPNQVRWRGRESANEPLEFFDPRSGSWSKVRLRHFCPFPVSLVERRLLVILRLTCRFGWESNILLQPPYQPTNSSTPHLGGEYARHPKRNRQPRRG